MSEPTTSGGGSAPNMDAGAVPPPSQEIAGERGESTLAATNGPVDHVEDVRRRIAAIMAPAAADAVWVTTPGLAQLLAGAVLEDSPGEGRTPDYDRRNRYVLMAVGAAAASGVPVGFLFDPAEPAWPCVMFELPTGQVGWHLPRHDVAYDGHTTPDKNARVDAWLAQIEEAQKQHGE